MNKFFVKPQTFYFTIFIMCTYDVSKITFSFSAQFLELPGMLDHSDLKFYFQRPKEPPKLFAWLTGTFWVIFVLQRMGHIITDGAVTESLRNSLDNSLWGEQIIIQTHTGTYQILLLANGCSNVRD